MKLATLINSALIATSIAFLPGIAGAQTATNNSTQPIAVNSNNLSSSSAKTSYLNPFNTVFLAYQGYLEAEGIPSGSSLLFEYQTGDLTALDVVKAGVKSNRLSPATLNDQDYISAVDSQLTALDNDFLPR